MSDKAIVLALIVVAIVGALYLRRERPWERPCERLARRCHVIEAARLEAPALVCTRRTLDDLKRVTTDSDCRAYNGELDALDAPR
ncbi:MAG: hypothetical protein HYV07_34280 [Deltaproteobacteria bacterium]|nr:hypothetical protein [Deltaproteobacteria bacterium]